VFFPVCPLCPGSFFSVGNQPVSNVFSLHLNYSGFFFGFPVGVVNFVWLHCWKKIPKKATDRLQLYKNCNLIGPPRSPDPI